MFLYRLTNPPSISIDDQSATNITVTDYGSTWTDYPITNNSACGSPSGLPPSSTSTPEQTEPTQQTVAEVYQQDNNGLLDAE